MIQDTHINNSNKYILDLSNQIVSDCTKQQIDVRILGSVSLYYLQNIDEKWLMYERKSIEDIDLIILRKDIDKIEGYFLSNGFEEDQRIKMLFGLNRRTFYKDNNLSIDLFIDNLMLCQKVEILSRIYINYPTLSVTDLFLSRIQRYGLTDADVADIKAILSNPIDLDYISDLCGRSWGWWKTITFNSNIILNDSRIRGDVKVKNVLVELLNEVNIHEKTFLWKIRNVFGTSLKWHELVEG